MTTNDYSEDFLEAYVKYLTLHSTPHLEGAEGDEFEADIYLIRPKQGPNFRHLEELGARSFIAFCTSDHTVYRFRGAFIRVRTNEVDGTVSRQIRRRHIIPWRQKFSQSNILLTECSQDRLIIVGNHV